jgi:DNA polymerase (family 10)
MEATMPIHNEAIASAFDELAELLELLEESPFRIRAYRRAAQSVRSQGVELYDAVAAGEDLEKLPGIGADLAEKIRELVQTGSCALRDELHRRVPRGMVELLQLPGLGPKRVRALHKQHDVTTPDQLATALARGRLLGIPGPATATGRRLLDALGRRGQPKRTLRAVAAPVAAALLHCVRAAPGVRESTVAGSFRRGSATVGDLDLLVATESPAEAIAAFCAYDEVAHVTARGRTRAAAVLANGLQVDLRAVRPRSYGAALTYFTGSKGHNIQLRRIAQRQGMKLSEYGLFRGKKAIAGATEESVYSALGLPWIPPELRENRGELEAAAAGTLPKLVSRDDLRGDLHVHTTDSDGIGSLEAMVAAAGEAGLAYVGISDHSKHVGVTHGLDAAALSRQIDAIDALAGRTHEVAILKGVEVDILEDGSLALPDVVLARLDFVIASVHTSFALSERKQTDRLRRALDNRHVTILGHPRCRLINEREPLQFDMEAVLHAAAGRGACLELNCQPARLDLPDVDCRMARDRGVRVAVGSDAHDVHGFALLDSGLLEARRAGLVADDVLNTLPLGKLRTALAKIGG